MAFLTSRTLATGVTLSDLFHIVKPYDFSQNPAGSSYKANVQQLFDSLSGYCLSDLYVSNIHSCSPLNINPLDEGNVYFGSTSGVTIDVINKRIGINTDTPSYLIDFFNNSLETRIYLIESSNTSVFNITGSSNNLTAIGVSSTNNTGNFAGISFGVRGFYDPTWAGYGNPNDSFVYSSNRSNGLNIISHPGTGTEDYIRFFAGQDADGTIPDMFIQGSGATRGYIGIGTSNPTANLDINGKTKTTNFQMASGATSGYVMVDSDGNGNGKWTKMNQVSGKNWISAYSTVDQTLSVIGTTLKMSANTSNGSGIVLSSSTKFVVSTTGIYNIQFSAQLEKTSGSKPFIAIWLVKNGINVPSSNTEVTIQGGNNERVVAAWNWVDEVYTPNTYYEIAWTSDSTSVFLSHVLSPTYGPEIPSVIISITQI